MGQDLRELLQNESFKDLNTDIQENHELRFLDRLNASFPEENSDSVKDEPTTSSIVPLYRRTKSKWYMSIAASAVITLGLGTFFFTQNDPIPANLQQPAQLSVYNASTKGDLPSLADISPEFKKVEDYYLTSINVELAQLKVNDDNKHVVDSFMEQLSKLDSEYKLLQKEMQTHGANTQTLEALIENLQMRLELLQQLKIKLKNLNEYTKPAYQNLQA